MNKIQSVIKLYKSIFPDIELEQKGAWIRIYQTDGSGDVYNAFYSDDLLEEIFRKTGNMYEWFPEEKELRMVAAHSDSLWSTSQTDYEGALEKSGYLAPKDEADEVLKKYDDIGTLATAIHMKADRIRHTATISFARKDGHDIVKLAKRIINLTEKK